MSNQNKTGKFKWDLRTILSIIVAGVVIYLLISGRLNFGGQGESSAASEGSLPVVTADQTTGGSGIVDPAAATTTTVDHPQGGTGPATTPAESTKAYVSYYFRSKSLLDQHYEKHGKEMGFPDAKSYEKAASDVINNPDALYKTEKEDGDHVYYIVATNEFVVLSKDGYIRTYFNPSGGKAYFDRQ